MTLEAFTLNGSQRRIASYTGMIQIEDIAADGKVLITAGTLRYTVPARAVLGVWRTRPGGLRCHPSVPLTPRRWQRVALGQQPGRPRPSCLCPEHGRNTRGSARSRRVRRVVP